MSKERLKPKDNTDQGRNYIVPTSILLVFGVSFLGYALHSRFNIFDPVLQHVRFPFIQKKYPIAEVSADDFKTPDTLNKQENLKTISSYSIIDVQTKTIEQSKKGYIQPITAGDSVKAFIALQISDLITQKKVSLNTKVPTPPHQKNKNSIRTIRQALSSMITQNDVNATNSLIFYLYTLKAAKNESFPQTSINSYVNSIPENSYQITKSSSNDLANILAALYTSKRPNHGEYIYNLVFNNLGKNQNTFSFKVYSKNNKPKIIVAYTNPRNKNINFNSVFDIIISGNSNQNSNPKTPKTTTSYSTPIKSITTPITSSPQSIPQEKIKTPKFNKLLSSRWKGREIIQNPQYFIIHYTNYSNQNTTKNQAILQKSGSVHYGVTKDGQVDMFLPTINGSVRAGSGTKHYARLTIANTNGMFSLPQNNKPGESVDRLTLQVEAYYKPQVNYPQLLQGMKPQETVSNAQLKSIAYLIYKHRIKPENVRAHWAVQPQTKSDPYDLISPGGKVTKQLTFLIDTIKAFYTKNNISTPAWEKDTQTIARIIMIENLKNAYYVLNSTQIDYTFTHNGRVFNDSRDKNGTEAGTASGFAKILKTQYSITVKP